MITFPDLMRRRESSLSRFSPRQVRAMLRECQRTRNCHIPLIGEERGDRAEVERIFVGTFPLTAGQATPISRDFPVGDPWLFLRINLRGQLNNAVGPTGTVRADAPLGFWNLAFTTDLDRDVIETAVLVRALFRAAQFRAGTQGDITAPTIVASTVTNFNALITVPFVDERALNPMDTVLDTRRYNAVTLTITTGQLADLVNAAVNITLQGLNADIEIIRVSPKVPLPLDVMQVLPFYKRHAPLAPAGDTLVNLDKIPTLAIKRLLFFASSGADVQAGVPFTGTGDDTVIDTIRVSSNIRDHFGTPVGGITRRTLRGSNKEDYSIENWPTGWYVADWVLDGSFLSALPTGDKSVLQALFLYQAGLPATPQVTVFVDGLQKLRGVEAVA